MKNKILLIISASVVIGIVSGIVILSEIQDSKPNYRITVTNSTLVNSSTFEFDILILAGDESFELTAYQCALLVWERLKDTDSLHFSYIQGSSEISIIPQTGILIDRSGELPKITFASLPGNEVITNSTKKIGRFRLENSNGFRSAPMLEWIFSGQFSTIITGKYFNDITVNSQLIVTGE